MKKRFHALFLTLCLLAAMCQPGAAVETAAGTQFEIHPPSGPVNAGETFTVDVDLRGNPGFCVVQFTLMFDRDRMECTQAQTGPLLSDAMSVTNPDAPEGAILAAISGHDIHGDGTLLTLIFTAKENLTVFGFGMRDVLLSQFDRTRVVFTVTGPEGIITPETTSPPDTPDPSDTQSPADPSDTPAPLDGPDTPDTPDESALPDTPDESGSHDTPDESGSHDNPDTPDIPDIPDESGTGTDHPEEADITPETSAEPRFTDTAGNWAEVYINQAADRDLFHGYPDGSFRPEQVLTRSEFMLVLWNLAGQPESSADPPFVDIRNRSEAVRTAVAWAWEAGYINGTSPDTFTPDGPLTRQAAMKILYGYSGADDSETADGMETLAYLLYENRFEDSHLIDPWGRIPMYWGVYHRILNGTSPTTLSPGGFITRAQLAAVMVRYTDRLSPTP